MALQYQEKLLADDEAPHAARVRVSIDVLDRAGYKAADVQVTVDGTPRPDLDEAIARALRDRAIDVDSTDSTEDGHTEPHTDDL